MKRFSFKKGVHLKYNKEITCDLPIERMIPKLPLVFPMQQHIGAPCKPVVKKGDYVKVGQQIGEATSYVSAPIYSSVSGQVLAVEPRMTHLGIKIESVVVENDGLYQEIEALHMEHPRNYTSLSKEEIVEIVKQAGLVGMGGAGFPTYIKLTPPNEIIIKHIVINAAECEPYLTTDHRVMLEETERIIEGIKILLHFFNEATAIIGVEDNKQDAIKVLKEQCREVERISVAELETKYPQGSEKHLIYATTKKVVPSGRLPADVGCVVLNVDSIVAIWRAIVKNRPIMRRIVTVSGSGVKRPCNLKVRLGTSVREILEYVGWDENRTLKVILGGPMMGMAISDLDIPVVKGTSGILCFTEKELKKQRAYPCIRCGKCIQVCPMFLDPTELCHMATYDDLDGFKANAGMDCIECGSCSYSCPSKRYLVQSIRTAKNKVRQSK